MSAFSNISPADKESSRHFADQVSLSGDDPQADRARELELLGDRRRADRVLRCRNPNSIFPTQSCKLRVCPGCAERIALRNAAIATAAIRMMSNPVVTLFSLHSTGYPDLATTIQRFRRALAKMRRQRVLGGVVKAIGALEMKAFEGFWNVHVHLVVDSLQQLDARRIDACWKRLVGPRGSFSTDGAPRAVTAIGKYLTKADTWCPAPGALNPQQLDILRHAIHGRQLLVRWGCRPKRTGDAHGL